MRGRSAVLGALTLLAVLGAPRATWAIRPLETEDPATVGAGRLELELGAEYVKHDGHEGGIPGKLTGGLLPWLDIAYETGALVVAPRGEPVTAGVSDSLLMLKAAWPEAETRPALGAVLDLRLPTGDPDRGLGERGVDLSVLGIVGRTFGSVSLFANGGYTFATADRARDTWLFSIAGTGLITERLIVLGEVVATVASHGSDHEVVVRGGLAYSLTPWFRPDLGVGVGLTRHAPDVVVTVGVTIGFR